MHKTRYMQFAAFLGLALITASASAWWNPDWANRKTITLDNSPTGLAITAPVNEVPVLVRLHSGNFAYFLSTLPGGGDLRFMAEDDTTPLGYHVERWDAINGIALVWVKVPVVNPGVSGKFRMYFNNPRAVKAQDPRLGYDGDMGLVFHFGETAGLPQDTTANANHAVESTAVATPDSLIAGGVRFNGAERITIDDTPTLAQTHTTGFTVSAWVRIDAPLTAPAVLFERIGAGGRLALHVEGTNVFATAAPSGGTAVETARTPTLTPATWHHLALVVGPTRTSVFLDGNEAAFVDAPAFDLAGPITLGATADGQAFFTGDVDEVQIARVARGADWLRLAHAGQSGAGTWASIGADETSGTAGGAAGTVSPLVFILMTVIGNEEAVIDQVVIGICGLMGFVAFLVMITKFLFLRGARDATRRFLHDYERLEGDQGLDALYEHVKAFRASPLFRVYRHGIDEVRKRMTPSAGSAGRGIDRKGLRTIRAAMDITMVREVQKMNAYMILLTIAISGGPFFGLLGTVLGVTATFGAIAVTGDINIASIAPGMGAALLTTIAGLGVAIPALLGYNYLGSQVKELSADMRVFAHDLLARISEVYGR